MFVLLGRFLCEPIRQHKEAAAFSSSRSLPTDTAANILGATDVHGGNEALTETKLQATMSIMIRSVSDKLHGNGRVFDIRTRLVGAFRMGSESNGRCL